MVVDNDPRLEPECSNEKYGTWQIMETQANESDSIFLDKPSRKSNGAITRTADTSF